MRSLVISIFLYACESWTLTAELEKRTQAFEMRCYRRPLNILYTEHVTNEEVRRMIQAAIGEYDELLTMVKKRKLKCSALSGGRLVFSKDNSTRHSNRKEWTLSAQLGQLKTGQDRKGLLRSHLWRPTTKHGYGIDPQTRLVKWIYIILGIVDQFDITNGLILFIRHYVLYFVVQ